MDDLDHDLSDLSDTRYPFGMWLAWNPRGVSKLERGNTEVVFLLVRILSLCVRFAAVAVPLLLLLYRCCCWTVFFAGAFEVQRRTVTSLGMHTNRRAHRHRQAPPVVITKR